MRAFLNKKTELYTLKRLVGDEWQPSPNAPAFKSIRGCIGWMDVSRQASWAQNWMTVVGLCEDDKLLILAERGGDLGLIGQAAIDLKDDLLIDKILVDSEADQRSTLDLRRLDGLTKYDEKAHSMIPEKKIWKHKPDDKLIDGSLRWPKFRDRKTTCRIIPVMDQDRLGLHGGIQTVRELARVKRLEVAQGLPRTDWVFSQRPPLDDVLDHPLCKAIIWCVLDLERTKPRDTKEEKPQPAVYGNLRERTK
jgi:hypothetical protein